MIKMKLILKLSVSLLTGIYAIGSLASASSECADINNGDANLYWGDLHVHSAYSLDAYAFGTTANPGDAIAFAKGANLTLGDQKTSTKLKRPLDFVAITDHAETFDVMYICTDPTYAALPYCKDIIDNSGTDSEGSLHVFKKYLLPIINGTESSRSPLCSNPEIDCDTASLLQWKRIQEYANDANRPCEFTAFVGYEWSATPSNQHWHRNIIFSGTSVTNQAIDYVRFPTPENMWTALDEQCQSKNNCDVIAIPHNTNLSEGGGFDVETSNELELQQRAKYERLIEIHQSKGNSECIDEEWEDHHSDCGFEKLLPRGGDQLAKADPDYIQNLNQSYARNIIGRGLIAYEKSGDKKLNPLQLGFIGSTDSHAATPGATEENNWHGDAWSGGGKFKNRRFERMAYNPGGLVGIWANANTRESLFYSLKERHAYATSGTRINLKFAASRTGEANICNSTSDAAKLVPMGGTLHSTHDKTPLFSISTRMDMAPLSRIEIIKGTVKNGQVLEKKYLLLESEIGFPDACLNWTDPDHEPSQPTYWYVRVFEIATPRWSKTLCEDMNNCKQHPGADRMIKERAWSSPIWYLP